MPKNHTLATAQNDGLAPALSGAATDFLNGTGAYSVPSSGLAAATQAEMETGTSNTVASTPGRQKNHPAHPKAWGFVTFSGGTPTLAASSGITSIADSGDGDTTVTMSTAMSSVSYSVIPGLEGQGFVWVATGKTTTVFHIRSKDSGSTDADISFSFAAFGDQ